MWSSFHGHLRCFHFFGFERCGYTHSCTHFMGHTLDIYLGVDFWGHWATLCLTFFEERPNCSPKWPYHFTIHHQCRSVPVSSYPCQCLLLSIFLIVAIFNSAQFRCSVVSSSLRPHGLQPSRPPCPSPTPRACSNSCPLSQWCHPTSHPVVSFSSCLQSFPASGSFPMSQFFASSGKSTGASALALVLPMNIQHWFPLRLTGLISLPSKRLSRVFSNTINSSALIFLYSPTLTSIHNYWKNLSFD